ncbi:DNA-3-methyladenine glycosylase family protein [Ohtaekwangia sp.]|uniref:DNA-3-methyladenine glycosylase family protein n=1 Tax=Ohtaekwangia sp. TaxID=2066019 RepID=UPI002FDE6168
MKSFLIPVPAEFSFALTMDFLKRSPREVMHRCEDNSVVKLLRIENENILFRVKVRDEENLQVQILNATLAPAGKNILMQYIREWFDLDTDIKPFYAMSANDKFLKDLVTKYHGYRIVGQPDLFESIVWAVLGQQINLAFAYTLKQRFVENFGEKVSFDEQHYYLFPRPEIAATLSDEILLPLQFSRQKSKYIATIGEAFASGMVSAEKLKGLPLLEAKEELMKIKGIGNWTANYALMKTFRYPDAFPLEDAGVHNAIKNLKRMKTKPTLQQVKTFYKKYKGWEAYATLYLWKSL